MQQLSAKLASIEVARIKGRLPGVLFARPGA
jgi:hypothetical protein